MSARGAIGSSLAANRTKNEQQFQNVTSKWIEVRSGAGKARTSIVLNGLNTVNARLAEGFNP